MSLHWQEQSQKADAVEHLIRLDFQSKYIVDNIVFAMQLHIESPYGSSEEMQSPKEITDVRRISNIFIWWKGKKAGRKS